MSDWQEFASSSNGDKWFVGKDAATSRLFVLHRPEAELSWSHDVFGNAIASATFQTLSDTLAVDSSATLDNVCMARLRHCSICNQLSFPLPRQRLD